MNVELIVCTGDHLWYNEYVSIPDDTEDKDIKEVASNKYLSSLSKTDIPDIAYIGIYSVESLEDVYDV